jgi:hypothetical protein
VTPLKKSITRRILRANAAVQSADLGDGLGDIAMTQGKNCVPNLPKSKAVAGTAVLLHLDRDKR